MCQITKVKPDGDCFFSCLSIFLFSTDEFATQLRHSVTNFVGKNWSKYCNFLVKPDGVKYADQYEYVRTAQLKSYFASALELGEKFNLSIVVHRGDETLRFGKFSNDRVLYLQHTGAFHSGHFDFFNTNPINVDVQSEVPKRSPDTSETETQTEEWET